MADRFEDLRIWQDAMEITKQVYDSFRNNKDFGFKDQIQRSAVSIPSNIAEGFERESNKEFIRFLVIAKGSCGELRTQLILANSFKYLDSRVAIELTEKANKLSKQIATLIKVRKSFNP